MNLDDALTYARRYTRFIPHHVREDAAQGAQVAVWRHWHPDATERDIRGWARTGATFLVDTDAAEIAPAGAPT